MNLSAVRLCFQAYLPDESGCFTKALPPCISDPVYDSSKMIVNLAYSYMDTVSYSSVDAWIYSVVSSWVLLINKNWSRVHRTGSLLCPLSPQLAMASCRFLFVSVVAIVVRFFAVVVGHALCRLFVIITLGFFFPNQRPHQLPIWRFVAWIATLDVLQEMMRSTYFVTRCRKVCQVFVTVFLH